MSRVAQSIPPPGIPAAEPGRQEIAEEVTGDGGSARSTLFGTLRRLRGWIALGALLAIVIAVGAVTAGSGEQDPLSPDNPAPPGARAIAEVLGNNGVEVVRAESLEDAIDKLHGSNDTLLLHDPDTWLTSEQLTSLGAGLADRTVLIEPSLTMLTELADGIRAGGVVPTDVEQPLQAACADPDARTASTVSPGGLSYRGAVTCFPLPAAEGGNPAGVFAATADGSAVVLGNGAIISNGLADEQGNAALALRVLGSSPTLVWYQPTQDDLAITSGPADPLSLLPDFVNPLMFWLLVTGLLAILWRARRLGPLVTEPLPVIVRSTETASGRARLYQDAGAVEHAVRTLRAGTLSRIGAALRIPPSGTRASVIAAAAEKTNREFADLERLLHSYSPRSDAQLVQWSQELEKLEQEIRRS